MSNRLFNHYRRLTFIVPPPKSGAELARYIAVASTSALISYVLYGALIALNLTSVVSVRQRR